MEHDSFDLLLNNAGSRSIEMRSIAVREIITARSYFGVRLQEVCTIKVGKPYKELTWVIEGR